MAAGSTAIPPLPTEPTRGDVERILRAAAGFEALPSALAQDARILASEVERLAAVEALARAALESSTLVVARVSSSFALDLASSEAFAALREAPASGLVALVLPFETPFTAEEERTLATNGIVAVAREAGRSIRPNAIRALRYYEVPEGTTPTPGDRKLGRGASGKSAEERIERALAAELNDALNVDLRAVLWLCRIGRELRAIDREPLDDALTSSAHDGIHKNGTANGASANGASANGASANGMSADDAHDLFEESDVDLGPSRSVDEDLAAREDRLNAWLGRFVLDQDLSLRSSQDRPLRKARVILQEHLDGSRSFELLLRPHARPLGAFATLRLEALLSASPWSQELHGAMRP